MRIPHHQRHTLTAIFALFLSISIVLISFNVVYHLPAMYGSADQDHVQAILFYLDGYAQLPEWIITLMSENEIAHMRDVAILFSWTRLLLFCSIIVTAALSYQAYCAGNLRRILTQASAFGAISIGIMTALVGLFFSTAFTAFHKVAFTNELWLLPPESYLITLFPEKTFLLIATSTLLSATISLGIIALVARHETHTAQRKKAR